MTKWLYDRWVEKDKFLEEFHRTGNFPDYGTVKPTQMKQDVRKIIHGVAFCFVNTIIQIFFFFWIYNLITSAFADI